MKQGIRASAHTFIPPGIEYMYIYVGIHIVRARRNCVTSWFRFISRRRGPGNAKFARVWCWKNAIYYTHTHTRALWGDLCTFISRSVYHWNWIAGARCFWGSVEYRTHTRRFFFASILPKIIRNNKRGKIYTRAVFFIEKKNVWLI